MSDEKTTVKGLWWKDHDTNHQLQGQITYGPLKGAEVDLFGQFNDSNQPEIARERFTLHGTTHDNKAVSLFACLSPGGHFSIPGGATTIVRAVSGIVGGHFHSLDDVKFKKVTSRFTALREWVWTTGITMLPESEGQLVNAAYALPPIIPLGKFGPLTTSIEFHATVKPGFNTLSIDQDCSLLIEADSMQPYEVFYECISSFQQFLTLALQRSA